MIYKHAAYNIWISLYKDNNLNNFCCNSAGRDLFMGVSSEFPSYTKKTIKLVFG